MAEVAEPKAPAQARGQRAVEQNPDIRFLGRVLGDVIRRFGQTSEEGGRGGTGIAVYKDAVYAEAGPTILRYRLAKGELVVRAEAGK